MSTLLSREQRSARPHGAQNAMLRLLKIADPILAGKLDQLVKAIANRDGYPPELLILAIDPVDKRDVGRKLKLRAVLGNLLSAKLWLAYLNTATAGQATRSQHERLLEFVLHFLSEEKGCREHYTVGVIHIRLAFTTADTSKARSIFKKKMSKMDKYKVYYENFALFEFRNGNPKLAEDILNEGVQKHALTDDEADAIKTRLADGQLSVLAAEMTSITGVEIASVSETSAVSKHAAAGKLFGPSNLPLQVAANQSAPRDHGLVASPIVKAASRVPAKPATPMAAKRKLVQSGHKSESAAQGNGPSTPKHSSLTNAQTSVDVRSSKLQKLAPAGSDNTLGVPHDLTPVTVVGTVYWMHKSIGTGSSCTVYRVLGPSKKLFALKTTSVKGEDIYRLWAALNEVEVLSALQDVPHVIRKVAHEVNKQDGCVHLVTEMGDCDLFTRLENLEKQGRLDLRFVQLVCLEILQALAAIHARRFVHFDVKTENLEFVGDLLKLIDFGHAKELPPSEDYVVCESIIGTPDFVAPEVIQVDPRFRPKEPSEEKASKVGREADMWSFGATMYQIVYGEPPFAALDGDLKFRAICNPQHKITFQPLRSKALENLMRSCLQRDPKQRPTAEKLLEHDFLKMALKIGEPVLADTKTYV